MRDKRRRLPRSYSSYLIVHIFAFHLPELLIMEVYIDHISYFYTVGLIDFLAIHLYLPSAEPLIYPTEGCFGEIFFDEFIDTLISVRWGAYSQ
jgi:hypothetical protein